MSVDDDVLRRLDELQAESAARRRELMSIAASVPATMSRRSLFRAFLGDLRRAPDKGQILSRAGRKLGGMPMSVARRIRKRPR